MKNSSAPLSDSTICEPSFEPLETQGQLDLAMPPHATREENVAGEEPGHTQPPEMMQAAWQQVMDILQSELSAPAYNNYLRHIKPSTLLDDRLVLSAPSDFVKDWLVRRFGKRIEETLEQFLGKPIVLAFQISPSEMTPGALSGSMN